MMNIKLLASGWLLDAGSSRKIMCNDETHFILGDRQREENPRIVSEK